MKGLLIVNYSMDRDSFKIVYQMLQDAATKQGILLEQYTNAEIIIELEKNPDFFVDKKTRPDFVIFWDKDVCIGKLIESYGIRLFNSSEAMLLCDDKARTYIKLREHDIKMPKTILIPMSFSNIDWNNSQFLKEIDKYLEYPLVLKECYGSFGEQVYYISSLEELVKKMNSVGNKPMIIQEYIESSKGRYIRIYVVGGKVVASVYRYPKDNDFRTRVTKGCKIEEYTPNKEQRDMAVKVCEYLGLDYGGVDILFDKDESPILCEVNSNAQFKYVLKYAGINVAEYIISYICEIMKK